MEKCWRVKTEDGYKYFDEDQREEANALEADIKLKAELKAKEEAEKKEQEKLEIAGIKEIQDKLDDIRLAVDQYNKSSEFNTVKLPLLDCDMIVTPKTASVNWVTYDWFPLLKYITR